MAKIVGLPVALLSALLCLCGTPATPANLPCSKASTAQENAICTHPKLSLLDEQVTSAYQTTQKRLSPGGAARVRGDQRSWATRLRVMCPDGKAVSRCLRHEYNIRLRQLKGMLEMGGMVFFPRQRVLSSHKEGLIIGDPRVSTAHIAWPNILQPTPRQTNWNAAMKAQALQFFHTTARDFYDVKAASMDVNIDYKIDAASDRLISVTLSESIWVRAVDSAEHYNSLTFLWLPQKQRMLAASDIFRSGSNWDQLLASRSIQQALDASRNAGQPPIEEAEEKAQLGEAVRIVREPHHWRLDPEQLTIVFPLRCPSVCIEGDFMDGVSTHFSWSELKPYLADGFDSASLPPIASP